MASGVQNLEEILRGYERTRGGLVFFSPIDIVFSEFDVVQPDLVFFRADRCSHIDLFAPLRLAPDLAVEVLSPGTAATDRGRKLQMFARYSVPECWIVDPIDRAIEILALDRRSAYRLAQRAQGNDMAISATVPELTFPIGEVLRLLREK